MLHSFAEPLAPGYSSVQRTNTGVATTTHTSSGTAHTYAANWTELVSSAPWDVGGITLRINTAIAASNTRSDTLVSIGVGAASSEQTVVGPFAVGFKTQQFRISLPLYIPSGSRIAVRHKSNRTSLALAYHIDLFRNLGAAAPRMPQRWVPYGITDDSSNSRGTSIPTSSLNLYGSWTSLTTSTTYAHKLWLPLLDAEAASSTTALNYMAQVAVASTTGALTMSSNGTMWDSYIWSTTTAELQNDVMTASGSGAHVLGSGVYSTNGIIHAPMPSGSAVSARAKSSSSSSESSVSFSVLGAVM